MRARRLAAALALAGVTAAGVAMAAGVEQLTTEELKALFNGNTFSGFHLQSGRTFTEYHHPDGRVIGHNGIAENTDGCWYVRNDAICYAYGKPKERQTYCFAMHRAGTSLTLTLVETKRLIGVGYIEPGNKRNHQPPNEWSCEDLVSRAPKPGPRLATHRPAAPP